MKLETVVEMYSARYERFFNKYYSEIKAKAVNHISKFNSKMPGRCWDLPAVLTCPGSFNCDGSLDLDCAKCYASKNTFLFKNVKQNRLDNMLAWQLETWTADMIKDIQFHSDAFFRFFASGDGYKLDLWYKIYQICLACEDTYFWIPTRMWKYPEFRQIIDQLNKLPNVVVRFSYNEGTGLKMDGAFSASIINKPCDASPDMFVCPAYLQDGKCGRCRECWSKNRQKVYYPFH